MYDEAAVELDAAAAAAGAGLVFDVLGVMPRARRMAAVVSVWLVIPCSSLCMG
ncbi:MAG: hypothetical protein U5L11_02640 [Arhodomonas sp.]|nr:hypothetical protein [Arhodomonas sp.]